MAKKAPVIEPEKETVATVIESKFSKKQLLAAKRFEGRKDLVNAVLADAPNDAEFTVEAVEDKINNFMKGKVK